LTCKIRKIAVVLKRRKVNFCCVQETKWKSKKPKKIGESYKIINSGKSSTMDGVRVVFDLEI